MMRREGVGRGEESVFYLYEGDLGRDGGRWLYRGLLKRG